MKILHLPSTFFPHYTGGKEVFVYQLIRSLPDVVHRVLLHSNHQSSYDYMGVIVDILPKLSTSSPSRAYHDLIYDNLEDFDRYLEEFKPDVVHFHDQSESASLSHLRVCKKKGIKTLLTYHSPGQSCLQRALIYQGKTPCDGVIVNERCTYCRYAELGVPSLFAKAGALLKFPFGLGARFLLRNRTEWYHDSWVEFNASVDRIQVHAHWVNEMLLMNNVPSAKITYVSLGGHSSLVKTKKNVGERGPLRLVYVGRCSDSKGIEVLVDAVKLLPVHSTLEIHFFGPSWSDTEYGRRLERKVEGDYRFKKPILLPPASIVEELSKMDVSVVPSLWPETGPFSVLDAFAAGLPVIGTNLAGIAERVQNGVNGLLFEWNNSVDLSAKIRWIMEDPMRIENLRKNIAINHTFEEMGADFYKLYSGI